MKQKVIMSENLNLFRFMSKQRISFLEIARDKNNFLQLNIFKLIILEMIVAYLIEIIIKKFCNRCVENKNQFNDCIVTTREIDILFFFDKCTNCALSCNKCSYNENNENQ